MTRDNDWLQFKLDEVWRSYFPDIPRLNKIDIKFGKEARRRLASIRQLRFNDANSDTKILVTGYFRDQRVPEDIIEATIAHELCHYAHGFASPLPKFSRYPHRGDIVDKELIGRGLENKLKFQNNWLKKNWNKITGHFIFR